MASLYTLQDPAKQYPLPKFKYQPQRVPGIARKMQPKPDHGEQSYRGSARLPNRKALVTGGDSGIGRAAAIAFAREGAVVVISYLPSEETDAKEVIELIEAAGRKAYGIPGDVSNESFCKKLIQKARKRLGGLDVLAIVAGKQHAVEKITDITTKQLEETYKINVFALFWLCKAALPLMPKGGSIISTASIQAAHPSPSLLDYALARQVAEDGIRVNCVAPGPVWTPLQTFPEFGTETPMKRPGQPVEMAPLYVLLASQESSYATGEVYEATGGLEIS